MAKRRLYVWHTKRKPQRYEHKLIIRRPIKRRKRKEKRVSMPFVRPPEDYTDSVCLLVKEKDCEHHHLALEVLIDADRLSEVTQLDWVIWTHEKKTHPYPICISPMRGMDSWILALHRFLMDPSGELVVDHKNHLIFDNREQNLRVCTDQQNKWNSKPRRDKAGRFKGVKQRCSGKNPQWIAVIQRVTVGTFREEEFAAYAYNVAAQRLYGEFAYQNEVVLREEEEMAHVLAIIESTDCKREQRKYWASQPKVKRKADNGWPQYGLALAALPED